MTTVMTGGDLITPRTPNLEQPVGDTNMPYDQDYDNRPELDQFFISPTDLVALQDLYRDPTDFREQALDRVQTSYFAFAGERGSLLFDRLLETYCPETLEVKEQVTRFREVFAEILNNDDRIYDIFAAIKLLVEAPRDVEDYAAAGFRSQEAFEEAKLANAKHLKPSDLTVEDVERERFKRVSLITRMGHFLGTHILEETGQEAATYLKQDVERYNAEARRLAIEKIETGQVSGSGPLVRKFQQLSTEDCYEIAFPERVSRGAVEITSHEPSEVAVASEVQVVESVEVSDDEIDTLLQDIETADTAAAPVVANDGLGPIRGVVERKNGNYDLYVTWNTNGNKKKG
jgi:hypothetical protein